MPRDSVYKPDRTLGRTLSTSACTLCRRHLSVWTSEYTMVQHGSCGAQIEAVHFLPRERVDAHFPAELRGLDPGPSVGIVLIAASKRAGRLVFPAFVFRGPDYFPTLETTVLCYSDDRHCRSARRPSKFHRRGTVTTDQTISSTSQQLSSE